MKKNKFLTIKGYGYNVFLTPGDRRSISLRMLSSKELEVRFPQRMSQRIIFDYIYSKSRWIKKKRDFFITAESTGAGNGIVEGRILYFYGNPYKVKIKGGCIAIDSDTIFLPAGCSIKHLEEWYREMSKKTVGDFIEKNCRRIPECTIKVKKQKNMWGSCNSKRRIYINLRISMCPQEIIEYVVWHEVCHLTHMNHSNKFYELLEGYCPDYKKHKQWLKIHSLLLSI